MPGREALSDAALLAASAAGDAAAFTRFVERHQRAALGYLRLLAADPAAIEDALQEAFLAAWRSAGEFRGGDSARSWLLAIARHALFRQYRRRVGEPEEIVSLDDLGRAAGWGEPCSPDPTAAHADRSAVRRALAALSAADREILLLRDVEGLSGEECAELLALALPAMKSRLHRARLRFAAQLLRGSTARRSS